MDEKTNSVAEQAREEATAEMMENFMQYIDEGDLKRLLFEFERCSGYMEFITAAIDIKMLASKAIIYLCKDKVDEARSEKRWEKVDKSEDIHAKKKKENGIVDFKKD